MQLLTRAFEVVRGHAASVVGRTAPLLFSVHEQAT